MATLATLAFKGALWIKQIAEPDYITIDASRSVDRSLLDKVKPHHRKAAELALNDIYGVRHEALFCLPAAVERFVCERLLNDPRDLQLFRTFVQVAIWLALSTALQLRYLDPHAAVGYAWGLLHFAITWLFFGQRFILAMHYAAHRPLFRASLGWPAVVANALPHTLMSNYFGMPSGAYYVHHCVMHHQSNNFFPYDISSTMPYLRSSPLHFFLYVVNFALHTFLYLPYYALRKGRLGLATVCAACLVAYTLAMTAISRYHPVMWMACFGYSFVVGPLALMFGNYCQHIFVDPDDPTKNYGLACNHLNHPFNMCTFNDGYHITHHVSSVTHWSEMPLHFIKNLDKYEQGGAILFDGINFMDLGIHVMNGEKGLRFLASKIVQLKEQPLSEAELIAMMKRRLQPIESEATKLRSSQLAIFMLGELMWIVYWACGFPLASVYAVAVGFFHVAYQVA